MKKIALISALALSGLFYNTANAQIHLGLRLGLHLPGATIAVQAPVYQEANYADNGEDYYYLPDIDAYYSVPEQCYYYNDGYNWVSAAYLPGEYRNYDWRNARRYEVRAHRPFMNNDFYRSRFRGNVGNWGRYNDHPDRNYANRDFYRDDHRDNAPIFERRGEMNWGAEHAEDRRWNNGNRDDRGWNRGRDDDHFDNRNQGGNYSQPNRDNQAQGNYNQRNNDNRNQGGNNNQPQQQDRGQGQPTRQNGGNNGGGNQRDNGGNQQHFTDNRGQQWGHDRMRS